MSIVEFQKQLWAAVKSQPPSDAVPYQFEKRIMARIRSAPLLDYWSIWNRVLWKAAAPCVAIMLLLSAWSWYSAPPDAGTGTLAADLETTVLAPLTVNLAEIW